MGMQEAIQEATVIKKTEVCKKENIKNECSGDPNPETIAAMNEDITNRPRFTNVASLMEYFGADELPRLGRTGGANGSQNSDSK